MHTTAAATEGASSFADPSIDLTPDDVARRLAAGELTLVDIREPHEAELSVIPGAVLLPIDRVASRRVASQAGTLDWSRPVVFHCRLGWRAGMVATAFRGIGRDAYNLDGGITAWASAGYAIEPADAGVADH